MKSPRVLSILFFLLLALPAKAETPFVIESAWVVANNEWLELLNGSSVIGGASLSFPDAIPANAYWRGATVTDGNTVGTIIILPVNEGHTLSGIQGFILRSKLRTNAIIAAAFPNGFHVIQSGEMALLYSPELSQDDIKALEFLRTYIEDLGERAHFSFIQYYPERTLFPTLPPERENEGEFIKKVRKRAATDYRDGQYVGTTDSIYVGLHRTNDDYKIVYEVQNIEGTSVSDGTESLPFNFGGFVDADALFNTAFRVPSGEQAFIKAAFFHVHAGFTVTPPEARQDEKNLYALNFGANVSSKLEEKDDYHMINDGNLFLFYPKQSEDRPEEDGVLSNEELDKMNEELVRGFFPFINNVRESLLSLDWSQPIDLAMSYENDVAYLAFVCPHAETYIDWNLAIQLAQDTLDRMHQIKPFDLPPDLPSLLSLVKIQETVETIAGLPCYRVNISHEGEGVLAVYVHEPGIFYAAALPLIEDSNEIAEEQYEAMQRRLEEKIEASRSAVAEKMQPPLTVLRSNEDGSKFRVDYEAIERGHRVTAYIAQESFGNVLALAQAWNINPFELLPFWQTQ